MTTSTLTISHNWSSRSEKTFLVSTPKCPGAQIWQTNLLWPMSFPLPPLLPFETAWWKSDSYVFPYHQWEPIQKSFDEKVTGDVLPPKWNCQWKWSNSVCIHTINENPFETVIWRESDRWCPPPKWNYQWKWSNSVHIHTINENPFETVIWWETDRWCPPSPIWNCQSTEWSLCCSMWSMRAHLKQSTYKKI